jgi:S-adenosylmethionine synthetase
LSRLQKSQNVQGTHIIPEKGTHISAIQKDAEAVIDEELAKIYKLTDRIVAGQCRVF